MEWYLAVLKKYAVFSGRASRTEYWMFFLFHSIISVVLIFIEVIFSIGLETGGMVLYALYSLAVLLPGLAVAVRRFHDTGRSGWWLLIAPIPLIGAIVLLVWTVQDSHPGENKYGPNPKISADPSIQVICPFCSEEIKAAAIVCKHCGRDLPNN